MGSRLHLNDVTEQSVNQSRQAIMALEISVIVPVRHDPGQSLAQLHQGYASAISEGGAKSFEFIYILDPDSSATKPTLLEIAKNNDNVQVVELARDFGEATSINIGAGQAKYDVIMTLPSQEQIKFEAIPQFITELEGHDVVLAKRAERVDTTIRQLPSRTLNKIVNSFSDAPFADASCGVRLFRKEILEEINLYGDFHRFLSMLAYEQGFRIKLVDLPQAAGDKRPFSSPVTYVRHLLDVLTVLFLTRFNKRPLRFFGSVGTTSLIVGALGMIVIAFQRLFMDMSAADRPLLLLFVLLAALGIQLIAIGLVGESLIFTHARDIKEYKIKKVHSK